MGKERGVARARAASLRFILIAARALRDYALLMRVTLIALRGALAILAMLALVGVALTVAGNGVDWGYGINALVIWWMTLCVAASGAVLMITGRLIMLAGVACAVTMILMLAFDWEDGPELFTWAMWCGAAMVPEIGLLMLIKLRATAARRVRRVTIASILLFTAAMYPQVSSVLELSHPYDAWVERMVMSLAVLNAAGTLAILLIAAIESRTRPAPETLPARSTLAATCPRCNAACTFAQGESGCGACGLRVTLAIEEPRCACGYLLYKLDSDKCPECGRAVRRPERVPATAEGGQCPPQRPAGSAHGTPLVPPRSLSR